MARKRNRKRLQYNTTIILEHKKMMFTAQTVKLKLAPRIENEYLNIVRFAVQT